MALAVFFKKSLSPTIIGIQYLKISLFSNALSIISAPIPAGSPIVMAITGRFFMRYRKL